jgi:hypothetical protein
MGCRDDRPSVRDIQRRRDRQERAAAQVDYLGDALRLVANYVELDASGANQRISGLLNSWLDENPMAADWRPTSLLQTWPASLRQSAPLGQLEAAQFSGEDAEYLRQNYLLSRITRWIDPQVSSDPVFDAWLETQRERLGEQGVADLSRAVQLFDWTVRNIQLESLEPTTPGPQPGPLPYDLRFRGPGYRQTAFQTLFRGSGDKLQRARVFIQLLRQAGIDACLLATAGETPQPGVPWAAAVRIADQLFLFEPELGLPIPGPEQTGIATLGEARSDESVMRRLNVPGWFDYPLSDADVQTNVALLDAPPAALSQRMLRLEEALVGESRLVLAYRAGASAEQLEGIAGIDAVRLWDVSLQAPLYAAAIEELAKSDQQLAFWQTYNYGMLGDGLPLGLARWRHLAGTFEKADAAEGAFKLYMQMRLPEFEIDALDTKVDLQRLYDVRRLPNQTDEQFAFQINQVQRFMRVAKRAASYWISLMHYDRGDLPTAVSWFEKRVLVEDLDSEWKSGARYALARALEREGQWERAEELYKTNGDPQEHGNRIRARLISRD